MTQVPSSVKGIRNAINEECVLEFESLEDTVYLDFPLKS